MSRPAALDHSVIDEALADSRWERRGSVLVLERRFDSFADALGFVTSVGALAERHDHHPDISLRWTLVTLELTTHDAGGLSKLDLDLAGAIEQLS